MKNSGEIDRIEIQAIPYAVESEDERPDSRVVSATRQFYEFLDSDEAFQFAELAAYTAFSKAYSSLVDHANVEILPKGHYPRRLRGIRNEVDGLLEIGSERFPVEVYNGIDYLVEERSNDPTDPTKLDQIEDRTMSDPVQSNPVLVSRLASERLRKTLRQLNGTVLDTGGIVASETNARYERSVTQDLHVSERVFTVPELVTEEGYELTGQKFDRWVTEYPERILPEKAETAADVLPDVYVRRVRGAVNLLFVNQLYRRTSDRIERVACLVVQYAYHHLLRSGRLSRDELFERGWQDLERNYRNFHDAKQFEDRIEDHVREKVNSLRESRVIEDRSTGLYARGADHPHADLTFPEGR